MSVTTWSCKWNHLCVHIEKEPNRPSVQCTHGEHSRPPLVHHKMWHSVSKKGQILTPVTRTLLPDNEQWKWANKLPEIGEIFVKRNCRGESAERFRTNANAKRKMARVSPSLSYQDVTSRQAFNRGLFMFSLPVYSRLIQLQRRFLPRSCKKRFNSRFTRREFSRCYVLMKNKRSEQYNNRRTAPIQQKHRTNSQWREPLHWVHTLQPTDGRGNDANGLKHYNSLVLLRTHLPRRMQRIGATLDVNFRPSSRVRANQWWTTQLLQRKKLQHQSMGLSSALILIAFV